MENTGKNSIPKNGKYWKLLQLYILEKPENIEKQLTKMNNYKINNQTFK